MFNYGPDWKDSTVRRLVARVGRAHIRDLLRLRRADQIGRCNRDEPSAGLVELAARIDRLLEADNALTLADLTVDGSTLMRELGIPSGPAVGVLLGFLLEAVIEDPAQNERGRLLELARNFYAQRLRRTEPDGAAGAGPASSG
jgi:poly(A) polymerase/tRNA nucleotidyltransferase (CCA-adding enzyme)